MKRPPSRPGAQQRRRRVLRAALACFSARGFSRTTLAAIRRRARASTGSIYHQFESKEHLAAELYLEGIADYQAGWLAALERETDARRGIRAVVAHHLRWVRSNEAWARFLFERRHVVGSAVARRRLARSNAELQRRAARWVAGQVEAGRLRRLPPDLYVAVVAGPYLEHTRRYLAGQECTMGERAIGLLADAAWRALRASPAPPSPARRGVSFRARGRARHPLRRREAP